MSYCKRANDNNKVNIARSKELQCDSEMQQPNFYMLFITKMMTTSIFYVVLQEQQQLCF
jgi:hypothetical protein